jgi:pimeloyl-ACP methyl ester carboxylesterase
MTRASQPRARRGTGEKLAVMARVALPFAVAWLGYRALATPRNLPLPPAVSGERRELASRAGRLAYYEAGPEGRTLLLVHSVNAAASAYEVRPLYERYRAERKVYALDLPGFGSSERSPREYTPRLMTDAILAMVEEIRRLNGPNTPIDALALSLSSEFLARAAVEAPGTFRSLALVSPTGFDARAALRESTKGGPGMPLLHDVLSFPPWSRALYDVLVSRVSIRYFLGRTWGSPAIDEQLLDYDYLTTHQRGAQYAPYAFVSGLLFSADIGRIYDALDMPVWLSHGVRGDFVDYSRVPAFAKKPTWTVDVLPTGALPHFEVPEEFIRRYDAFLAGVSSQSSGQ